MMKLFSGLALASASLLSFAAHAAAPDPAPTLATDAQGVSVLTGAHHLDGAAFSLIVTDWWLTGTVGVPAPDVRLVVEVHVPQYPLLDRATDAAGRKLDVIILARGPSARWPKRASERVAVVLPGDVVEKARTGGLAITVSGKDRSFPIAVPGPTLDAFYNTYLTALASDTTPASAPTAPPPSAAPPVPSPQTAPPSAASPPPVSTPPASQPEAAAPATPASPPAASPAAAAPATAQATSPVLDSSDAAVTPLADTRVRNAPLPAASTAPQAVLEIPPAPPPRLLSLPGQAIYAPTPEPSDADAGANQGGDAGTPVDSIGLQFVPTSSGAMVILVKPGSIAATRGIESGDFVEKVDGVDIKALTGEQMAAKIGAPGVKVLHMIAAGDIKIR